MKIRLEYEPRYLLVGVLWNKTSVRYWDSVHPVHKSERSTQYGHRIKTRRDVRVFFLPGLAVCLTWYTGVSTTTTF